MPIALSRRMLAPPFVVTLAAACQGPVPIAPAKGAPAAAAAASAGGASAYQIWDVSKVESECSAKLLSGCGENCIAQPEPYACPAGVSAFPVTVERKAGAASCEVLISHSMDCPPDHTCNPPPPERRSVPCPK